MADDAAPPAPLKTYRGNCHCAAFVYEVDLPEIKSTVICNCSICHKKAYEWVFPAHTDLVRFVKGDMDGLKAYSFGQATTLHLFCPTCGTAVMGHRINEPAERGFGMNARTIQDLNTWVLEKIRYDGAALGDPYKPAPFTGPEPQVEIEGAKLYTGGCHCGAVTLMLKSKPLDENTHTIECSCSICQRHGPTWLYPEKNQTVICGEENLTAYDFASRTFDKKFCATCGVVVYNSWKDLSDEQVAARSEITQKFFRERRHVQPINLRVLDGFDLNDVKPKQLDAPRLLPPLYVNP